MAFKYAITNNSYEFSLKNLIRTSGDTKFDEYYKSTMNKKIKHFKNLFAVNENKSDVFKITLNLDICDKYLNFRRHDGCKMLHLCPFELTFQGCPNKSQCSYQHSINTSHNINTFLSNELFNINRELILDILKVISI